MGKISLAITLAHASITLLCLAPVQVATAQQFPTKPIRWIVGPSSELPPRVVAQRLSQMWGQQVLVDARPGGGGTIAAETVLRALPDGYTWLYSSAVYTMSASLVANPTFDLVRDFAPVTLLISAPFYLTVHPSLAVQNVKELTALAKERPSLLNYASSGIGTPLHLAAELYKSMAGINIVHVPYKTVSAAMTEQIAGQVQISLQYGPVSLPQVRAGKLRGLASTSLKRSPFAPEFPTMDESGLPGYEVIGWNGLHVPKNVPASFINKLSTDVRQALQAQEVQERLSSGSLDIHGNSRTEFDNFVNRDRARWIKVVKDAGITPE